MGDSTGVNGVGVYCEHRVTFFDICKGLHCCIHYTFIQHDDNWTERDLVRMAITDDEGNETNIYNDNMNWIFRVADAEKFPHESLYGIILDQENEDNYTVKHSFYL